MPCVRAHQQRCCRAGRLRSGEEPPPPPRPCVRRRERAECRLDGADPSHKLFERNRKKMKSTAAGGAPPTRRPPLLLLRRSRKSSSGARSFVHLDQPRRRGWTGARSARSDIGTRAPRAASPRAADGNFLDTDLVKWVQRDRRVVRLRGGGGGGRCVTAPRRLRRPWLCFFCLALPLSAAVSIECSES